MFSIEAIPCLTALPLQARLGLLFSFSAYLRFLSTASLRVETHWFPLTLGWPLPPDSLTTGSHTSNRAGLGLGWCCSPSDRPKTAAQGQVLVFLCRTSLPLPLKGEGLDIAFLWGFGFSLAVAFGNCWPQLGHAGPTGPVRGFAGVVPHPALKTAHRATQGRVWFHRRFLVRFFCGIPASWRSRW